MTIISHLIINNCWYRNTLLDMFGFVIEFFTELCDIDSSLKNQKQIKPSTREIISEWDRRYTMKAYGFSQGMDLFNISLEQGNADQAIILFGGGGAEETIRKKHNSFIK